MALDRSKLGNLASEQMQALEETYGDDESAQVGAVLTIVQVLKKVGDDEYNSTVRMRHNVADPYAVIGLLKAAEMTVTKQIAGSE
jgi:hypothetical protein